jgi:hypothetical protein
MTRAEILSLIQQAAAALTTEPQTPATYTEEDRVMIREIHAATVGTVALKGALAVDGNQLEQPARGGPLFTSIPASPEPPLGPLESASKKPWWKKLGTGMKTALAGIAFGAGGGALGAVVDAVKDGNVNPGSLAGTAAIAAITGAIGYYQKGPREDAAPQPPQG